VLGRRADKDDPFLLAPLGKLRVFGKKSVTRMDRVDVFALGDLDDAFDVEVGLDGAFPLADQVRLIGFISV